MKPDFICIGAQKAGTSWLYEMISNHPECAMPPVKELHYFDRSTDYPSTNVLSKTRLIVRLKKMRYLARCFVRISRAILRLNFKHAKWWIRYHFSDFSDSWYLDLFQSESLITGDITPSYALLNEADVKRMKELLPDVKLVFILRNPICRAWSMLKMRAGKSGNDTVLSDFRAFKRAVDSNSQSLRSDYIRTIDLYSKYFDQTNVLIGFFDAIEENPKELLDEICNHIGCNQAFYPDSMSKPVNQSVTAEIPKEFLDYLNDKYRDDITELANRYGTYANKWLQELDASSEDVDGSEHLTPVVHP